MDHWGIPMLIKRKHISVTLFSSIIVAIVFVSTLIGYSIYIQWKKDSFVLRYRNSIYKLTAELFKNNIFLSDVNVKLGTSELFLGMPIVEGSLRNGSNKTVISILIEISFLRPDGAVVYNDWVYPLAGQHFDNPQLFSEIKQTRNILSPGENISFKHLLKNCPREITEQLYTDAEFAKQSLKNKIKLVCSITGLSVL